MKKITILGAGHAGICLFANLKLKGYNVKLYSDDSHTSKLDYIIKSGRIIKFIDLVKKLKHKVEISNSDLCSDFSEVVLNSDIIYNTLPIQAHKKAFIHVLDNCCKINKSVAFVNLAGGFGIFQQILEQKLNPIVDIYTFHTLPFASRIDKNTVMLLNVRNSTAYANNKNLIADISFSEHLFDANLTFDTSILHMSLDRSSYHMHPAILLANIGYVEANEPFYFYKQGLTSSVNNLLIACGKERAILGKLLGYTDYPDPQTRMSTFHGAFMKDFSTIIGPSSLNHRFLNEDIEYGLVPLCTLGEINNVNMPISRSLINMASALTGANYWDSPMNLCTNKELAKSFMEHV